MTHQGNALPQEGLQQLWLCLVGGVQEYCLACPDPLPTAVLYVHYRKVCHLQQQRPIQPSLTVSAVCGHAACMMPDVFQLVKDHNEAIKLQKQK